MPLAPTVNVPDISALPLMSKLLLTTASLQTKSTEFDTPELGTALCETSSTSLKDSS